MPFLTDSFGISAVVVVAIAASVTWYFAPLPESGSSPAPREDLLEVAAERNPDLKKAAQTIVQKRLWGEIAAGDGPKQDPEWHFVGIAGRGKDRFVMLKVAGKPVETLQVGDSLPGGAAILEIGDDRLCILINDKKRALEIYRR